MKKFCLLLGLMLGTTVLSAQSDAPRNWSLNGYVKNLQTLLLFNDAYPEPGTGRLVDTFLQDNLVHNRLNSRWFLSDQFTLRAEMRNRLFFGDLVKAAPDYAAQVDNVNNDYFDLSLILLDDEAFVMHAMLDRVYLEYISGDWEVRLGRQRINWGISTVWNPNDIFNAFAFTDFDYEERPGSDALRIRKFTGFASSVELAVKVFDDWDEAVMAGMWKFHTGEYDIQLLGGYMERFLVAGGGWAGNLGDAGLKGEATYFHALDDGRENSFAMTAGLDYTLASGWYFNLGVLYNSNGTTTANAAQLFDFELSARNLYPYKYSIFTQFNYPLNPLLTGGVATIYSPGDAHALFINPTATLSVAQNWDLDLIGQIVLNEAPGYVSPIQAIFLRIKYSF